VRSLGYVIVGLNEFYTSRKCPNCEGFVAQVTLRQLYCPTCRKYFHRYIMAAQNMSNIAREYLLKQERPMYLEPKTADGRYPWRDSLGSGHGAIAGSSTSTAQISVGTGRVQRKRSTTAPQERPAKIIKEI
ncbi:hypothetical protein FBU30_000355, partial [Linnemannia zychae]